MISTVKQADGTIGYADFSQVGDLGTVAVKVGDKYNEISAEAGSKVIGDSKQDDTVKGDNRIVIKINHATEAEGAYPIVLVSYDIVCPAYKDTKQAEFAKAWLTYVTSDEARSRSGCRRHRSAALLPEVRDHQVHRGHQDQVDDVGPQGSCGLDLTTER